MVTSYTAYEVWFPTRQDSAFFGTKGQKFPHCPGTKGQRDKLKILLRAGTGRGSQNLGWDGVGQPKSRMGRKTKWDRAEKDVQNRKTTF